ncbi:MAG: YdgA family protein [Deltaproteobacteria bacterium]
MKKTLSLTLAIALLGGGYIASTWYTGKKIEGLIGRQYQLVEALPYAKMVKRDFRRGLFNSEETVTFELFNNMLEAVAKAQTAKGQAVTTPENFKVTVRTRIQNGPFPNFSRLAAAVGESELILSDSTKEKVKQVFGDQKPITCQTVFHFDGSFSSTIKSPAVSVTLPPEPQGTGSTFLWDGFEAQIDSAPNMQHYTMNGRVPKIEIKGDDRDVHMLMSNLRFQADQKRMYQNEPLLFSGSQLFSIDELQINNANDTQPPVTLKQLQYRIDMPFNGDFVDLAFKLGIAEAQATSKQFGPAHFDFTFKHLHARTVADMYHNMLEMYAKPMDLTGQPDAARAQILSPLLEHAKVLLKHNPEFIIDRISFAGPAGETRLTANVKLNEAAPDDLNNPVMLLPKLEAAADAAVPEEMLYGLIGSSAGKLAEAGSSSPEDKIKQFRAQIAQFSEQGYITKENKQLKIHAEFKNGQFRLNGKPFPPAAVSPESTPTEDM